MYIFLVYVMSCELLSVCCGVCVQVYAVVYPMDQSQVPCELLSVCCGVCVQVYAGVYPMDQSQVPSLRSAIERLTLNDSSVSVQVEARSVPAVRPSVPVSVCLCPLTHSLTHSLTH